ncbi:MAG: uroporphyrinogen-III synthase, partial [Acidobacteriota bacterium]
FAAVGATVVRLPLLACTPPADDAPLRAALAPEDGSATATWTVFTSPNAVDAVCDVWLRATGRPPEEAPALGGRLAAVGPATDARLAMRLRPADLVAPPGREQAFGLLSTLLPQLSDADHVLVPQAADARPTLVDGLRDAGIWCTALVAYDKGLPADAASDARLLFADDGPLGWVTFTSPRIADHFASLFGAAWPVRRASLRAAAIGPVTAAHLAALGIEHVTVAARPTPASLVDAVVGAAREMR